MMNILNWLNVITMVMKIFSFFKKSIRKKEDIKLTRTDKLIDSMDKAEKIKTEMELCGYIALSMIDEKKIIKEESKKPRGEGIKDVFEEMGMSDEIFEQVEHWVRTSQFFWASYADELKILYSNLPREMKGDVLKHKAKKRKKKKLSKRKLKKIHDKYAEDTGVKNKAGMEALEKLAKDLDRVRAVREKKENENKK